MKRWPSGVLTIRGDANSGLRARSPLLVGQTLGVERPSGQRPAKHPWQHTRGLRNAANHVGLSCLPFVGPAKECPASSANSSRRSIIPTDALRGGVQEVRTRRMFTTWGASNPSQQGMAKSRCNPKGCRALEFVHLWVRAVGRGSTSWVRAVRCGSTSWVRAVGRAAQRSALGYFL